MILIEEIQKKAESRLKTAFLRSKTTKAQSSEPGSSKEKKSAIVRDKSQLLMSI